MSNNAIVRIRDDLRIEDNSALVNASLNHSSVTAVYIFNKEYFDNS
mgnify:FL=1